MSERTERLTEGGVDAPTQALATRRGLRTDWTTVCELDRLVPDRGVAAMIGDRPVAVFRRSCGELHALDNVDPISRASIMSRGIVGELDGRPTVASPMYKQRFDLRTGACVDDEQVRVSVHDVAVVDGVVLVRIAAPR